MIGREYQMRAKAKQVLDEIHSAHPGIWKRTKVVKRWFGLRHSVESMTLDELIEDGTITPLEADRIAHAAAVLELV